MSKYQKLYSLTENLYAEGSPLIIAAGALQKDTENGSVYAQIKLQNINQKRIKVVRAVFSLTDAFDRIIGETEYVFQDFIAGRDEFFCQKQLVPLDNATRSFVAKVSEVAFSDGTKWNESDAEWKPIEKQQPISYLLKDAELIKQYHIKYGNSCDYLAKTDRDLVLCSCGEVNKAGENSCHKCRNNLSALLSHDIAALTAERDARLAEEAKAAEEKRIAEAKAAEERRIAEEKAKRKAKIAGIVAACAAVCIGLALLTVKVIVPTMKYNNAVELFNNKQYEEAITAFEALDGYKDSAEQISDCQEAIKERDYNAVVELLNNEQYEEARAAFEALDGYKDSDEKIVEIVLPLVNQGKDKEASELFGGGDNGKYKCAVALMNNEQYEKAMELFVSLDRYKDSFAKKTLCMNALYEDDYQTAVSLFNDEKYKKAKELFEGLNGYKDSDQYIRDCNAMMK